MRNIVSTLCVALVLPLTLPLSAYAAGNAQFELRPHCEDGNAAASATVNGPQPQVEQLAQASAGRCPRFEVRDPVNLQTARLNSGDVLDMDLVIKNPDRKAISRFRAWITYDTNLFEGEEITISPTFPVPTPGENAFSKNDGFLKISGTSQTPVSDDEIVVARIRMKVLQPRTDGTPLTYFDLTGTPESKTGIFEQSGTTETNVLMANPGYVYVRFATASSQASVGTTVSSVSPLPATTSSVAQSSEQSSVTAPPSTVFTMLQVQGVRVTTEGSSVFLAWDVLPSADLAGYNIYYGTTTGRYIQRRSVEKAATTLTLRALPVGTTYYFAVRGVQANGQETEFSQEVAVSVGNPSTSTSPLSAHSLPTPTPGTDGTVSGETGISSVLLLLVIASALTGTALAFRRQMNARV